MRLNTSYLSWGLRRAVAGRALDLKAQADQSWELCPAETARVPPAIYPAGSMDRVTQLSPWCDWDRQRLLVDGGQVDHAATEAHVVRNVAVRGAYLYSGAAKAQPGFGEERLVLNEAGGVRRFKAASMMSQWAGSHFFGSFLRDEFPLALLPDRDDTCISVPTKAYVHEDGYRKVLSVPQAPCVSSARVDALTLFSDFSQNSSKRARYRELRHRLRRHFADTPRTPATGVYLKRGATGERRVVANEDAVESALAKIGFDIVEPSKLTAVEIARRLLDSPIIIGVEGSHLAHTMYSIADDGVLVVLQPPDRFALPYKEFADCLELRFAFIVGHAAPDGFTVDIDDINRVLDEVAHA